MLPGLRFLFAAVVLAVSFLVFGLGAAALLRGAHEEFASIPARRTAPPATFGHQSNDAAPTLAMLRLEPRAEEAAPIIAPQSAVAEPAPVVAASVDPAPAPAPVAVNVEAAPAPAVPSVPIEAQKLTEAEPTSPPVAEAAASRASATEAPADAVTPQAVPEVETTASTDASAGASSATLTEADTQLSSTEVTVLAAKPDSARSDNTKSVRTRSGATKPANAKADTKPDAAKAPAPKKPAAAVKKVKKAAPVKKRKHVTVRRSDPAPRVQPQYDLFGQPFTPVQAVQ